MDGDWPLVRGNLSNTGATQSAGPIDAPELRWRHDAGDSVFGTPLVVGERVYVATCAQTHHSIDPVVAIDRESGDRLWMAAADAMEVRGTPAVSDGRLYLGDLDGFLFVLDENGRSVERTDELRVAPADGVHPLVADGTLFTQIYCLEARDSESLGLQWQSGRDVYFEAPFALADDRLFAGGSTRPNDDEVFVGLDEADVPQFVYPETPFVRAANPKTGAVLWETRIDGRPRGTAVVDGTVFAPVAGSDPLGQRVGRIKPLTDEQPIPDEEPTEYYTYGVVYALDSTTGAERWSTRLSSPIRTMPAVDGDYVCVGTAGGTLVALDAATGEMLWQRSINEDDRLLSSPTIARAAVYVGSADGALLALSLEDGDELWRFETDAGVDANPSVVDGVLYVGDNLGTVYALE